MATETGSADCHGRLTSASSGSWGSSAPSGRPRPRSSARAGCSARSYAAQVAGAARSSPGSSAASRSSSWPWCTPSSARCTRCPAAPRGSRTSRSAASRASRSASSPGCRRSPSPRSSASRSCTTRRYWWPAIYNPTPATSPALGFVLTVVLMAVFAAVNFLGIELARPASTARITWWKIVVPVLTIIVLLFKFHGGNFCSAGRRASCRPGSRACSRASSAPASCSPTSASSRPTSWPARSRTRSEPAAGDHQRGR